MKYFLIIARIQLKIMGLFSSAMVARKAFAYFERTSSKKLSAKERRFYNNSSQFILSTEIGNVAVYENGDIEGQLIFLVHGWNSNAGSMGAIAEKLAKEGHHVISFDLPGHYNSKRNKTNIYECKIAFQSVVRRFKSDLSVSVVAHSFGSAVAAYALSEMKVKVDSLIYLTAPNTLNELFIILRESFKLGDQVHQKVIAIAERILKEPISKVVVTAKTEQINYSRLFLIHDKYDKVLPFKNSLILNELSKSELIQFEKIGHYRMLWDSRVLSEVIKAINFNRKVTVANREFELIAV